MDPQMVLGILAGIGLLVMLGLMVKNKIIYWISRAGMGALMIIVMNVLLPQSEIGFNLYTIGFSTLLGLPGVMTMYLFKLMI